MENTFRRGDKVVVMRMPEEAEYDYCVPEMHECVGKEFTVRDAAGTDHDVLLETGMLGDLPHLWFPTRVLQHAGITEERIYKVVANHPGALPRGQIYATVEEAKDAIKAHDQVVGTVFDIVSEVSTLRRTVVERVTLVLTVQHMLEAR